MTIELIKKTIKITGKLYYYISVDGDKLISQTWTDDYFAAREHLKQVTEAAKKYPEDVYEILESVTI